MSRKWIASRYGTTQAGGAFSVGTVFKFTRREGTRWTEELLYSFDHNGIDGYDPVGGLTLDRSGNLYGTSPAGGAQGLGTVFEIKP
jgi:uncharacterized repeat protein (TIGR03803 family)